MIGVQLTILIFAGGATQSRVPQTLALADQAATDLDTARSNAALSARQAFLGVVSGLAQVRALQTADRSANTSLESNLLGYQVGVRINIMCSMRRITYFRRTAIWRRRVMTR